MPPTPLWGSQYSMSPPDPSPSSRTEVSFSFVDGGDLQRREVMWLLNLLALALDPEELILFSLCRVRREAKEKMAARGSLASWGPGGLR